MKKPELMLIVGLKRNRIVYAKNCLTPKGDWIPLAEFLKFSKREFTEFGSDTEISTPIRLPKENWKEVEEALKLLGHTFRSPSR